MRWQFILVVLLSLLVVSCEADLTDIGSIIQPADDAIMIEVESFSVSSSIDSVSYIYSKPDSFLLGTFVDDTYGTIYADILTQLQPPVGTSYPKTAKADSAKFFINYYSWFGDKYSPLEVKVFKMDMNKTFNETELYKSNINVNEYCSKSVLLGSKVFTAVDYAGGRKDPYSIEIKLDTALVFGRNKFSSELDSTYSIGREANFHNAFKGLYITTNFGTASMLNVNSIFMRYYYSYPVLRKDSVGNTYQTTFNTYLDYPANEEVRSVNRFLLPQKPSVFQKFNADPSVNVISSPSNIYTNITIPLNTIQNKLNSKVGNKTLLLNRAKFRVNITDIESATLAIPPVGSVMMMYESKVDDYFKKRQLPSDTISVIANVSYEYDENKNVVYYYSFDLAKIMTNELNKKDKAPQELKFRLIPVSITYDGSKNIKDIKQQNLMRAVKVCSATHADRPMRLDMVYSGF